MAAVTESALAGARRVAANATRSLRTAGAEANGRALALVAELSETAELLERIVGHTRLRLAGQIPTERPGLSASTTRRATDRQGSAYRPDEFGYLIEDTDRPGSSTEPSPTDNRTPRRAGAGPPPIRCIEDSITEAVQ